MPLNFGTELFGRGIFKRSPNDDQVMTSAGSRQIPADQTVDTDTTYVDADFDHDQLTNFDADKHKAWLNSIADNIHADNYTNTTYVNGDFDHDQLTNFNADKHKAWAASIAENIHADNYTDTGDTTYTAGTGIGLAGTEFTSDDGNIVHDSLSGFDVNKHREWASSIAQNIHANNYTDTQPTKEFYVTPSGSTLIYLLEEAVSIGDFVVPISREDSLQGAFLAGIAFKVPHDFTSITSAEIIFIPDTTNGTANVDYTSDYGAVGENYNNHSASDTAATYNLTANKITVKDVSGLLSSMAANDYVGIKIQIQDEDENLFIIGFHLRYT